MSAAAFQATYEEWRAVPGYEDAYEVSSFGRVRSLSRTHNIVRGVSCFESTIQGRHLRPGLDSSGYRQVSLSGRMARVSNLVALAFIGPRPIGHQVCHNNGDRTFDRPSNLRYDTRKGNAADRIIHGTDVRGSKSKRAKLVEADVLELRALANNGIQTKHLCDRFKVSPTTIRDIVRRRRWRHV